MKLVVLIIAVVTVVALPYLNIGGKSDGEKQTTNKALQSTHTALTKIYTNVPHLKANDLVTMDEENIVVFDVRDKDEYAISHIKNATRVDPSIDALTFYEKFGHQLADKTVVLYCSVGARSSILAEKLINSDIEKGTSKIYNLENGIFGWHNESRPLFQLSEPTEFVHPYNRVWGLLVNRDEFKRYEN